MQTCFFFSKGSTLSAVPGLGAPMFKNTFFQFGKQQFRWATFAQCLSERSVGFAGLREGSQFVAHVAFLQ
jgi:hypothetical protein